MILIKYNKKYFFTVLLWILTIVGLSGCSHIKRAQIRTKPLTVSKIQSLAIPTFQISSVQSYHNNFSIQNFAKEVSQKLKEEFKKLPHITLQEEKEAEWILYNTITSFEITPWDFQLPRLEQPISYQFHISWTTSLLNTKIPQLIWDKKRFSYKTIFTKCKNNSDIEFYIIKQYQSIINYIIINLIEENLL